MDGLVKDINFGIYDFGTERTLEDYERYAGLSFKKRAAQKYTIDNKLAPNPPPPMFRPSTVGLGVTPCT